MQFLRTNKIHATSLDKKKDINLLGLTKITQPLGTRKKNRKTSLDKKNHATSWDKKITQPLGTKRNHATSWDKKSHNLSGPNWFKWVYRGPKYGSNIIMNSNGWPLNPGLLGFVVYTKYTRSGNIKANFRLNI